ncbi:hypothetical protein [Flavobacterium kingsejongi]|nr:hypothetical protein [Flavobacterium kingsejongi]
MILKLYHLITAFLNRIFRNKFEDTKDETEDRDVYDNEYDFPLFV